MTTTDLLFLSTGGDACEAELQRSMLFGEKRIKEFLRALRAWKQNRAAARAVGITAVGIVRR